MPRKLQNEEVEAVGVKANHEQMDNGERRYRLMCADNSGYIRVEAGASGEWQNSHYHTGIRETTIVQVGWIVEASLINGSLQLLVIGPGGSCTSRPGIHHNQYMAAGTKTHTVKFGDCSHPKDWHASPELDAQVKSLDENLIFSIAGFTEDAMLEFKSKAFA